MKPSQQQISEAAYYRWINMGSPCLDEVEQKVNWLEAEKQLTQGYRVLLKTDKVEIRKYKPCKRIIRVAGKEYYLQFPYMVFALVNRFDKSSFLYVAFAKENDDVVYFPSVPNINSQTWAVCLSLGDNHFRQPRQSIEKLIARFWSTEFNDILGWKVSRMSLEQNFQLRFNYWKGLTLKEVFEHITYMPRSLEDFEKRILKEYTDSQMRALILDLKDVDPVVKPGEKLIKEEVPLPEYWMPVQEPVNIRILPPIDAEFDDRLLQNPFFKFYGGEFKNILGIII